MSSAEEYNDLNECPQMSDEEKEIRILRAVKCNNVELLKTLLDSPRWYKITNDEKYPLLHIAILHENEDVFDFLLSLPDYPLELINDKGHTALMIALTGFVNYCRIDLRIEPYYAIELIERGADIYHQVSPFDTTFLHIALERQLTDVVEILIEKGLDVNEQDSKGNTPLHICCTCCDGANFLEGVSMLLCAGADPMIRNFDGLTPFDVILRSFQHNIATVKETLFYYIFDQYTEYDIDAEAFMRLTELDSTIFYEIVKHIRRVINCDFSTTGYFQVVLFSMRTHHLQIIIEKFDYVVKKLLCVTTEYIYYLRTKPTFIDNCFLLMNSKLKSHFIEWLCRIDLGNILRKIISSSNSESSIQEFVCLLLSYGSRITEQLLEIIYQKFGYCELFKILLHMDLKSSPNSVLMTEIMPFILYNVTLDVPEMIRQPHLLPPHFEDLEELLPFYTVPSYEPRVPLLVELARNVFRRYFIKRLDITNARQFYTLVNVLPISTYHKKIITLEEQLY